jgi:hypothetical protein
MSLTQLGWRKYCSMWNPGTRALEGSTSCTIRCLVSDILLVNVSIPAGEDFPGIGRDRDDVPNPLQK